MSKQVEVPEAWVGWTQGSAGGFATCTATLLGASPKETLLGKKV